jgi:predicted aconitase
MKGLSALHIDLTAHEKSLLDGASGDGVSMAMRLVVRLAQTMGAERLRPISGAHIDSCLYHGQSGLDYVNVFVDSGAKVVVPTTLNVSSLDLLHPELFRGDPATGAAAKALVDAYVALGCEPTWTCAPYQREQRPGFGEHVAWAESNAVVFANSVLGARTHRYGDFIDIAAAITGRVPDAGLHRTEMRRATQVVDVSGLSQEMLSTDAAYPMIGFVLGRECGSSVPVIVGLPEDVSEDNLKALGAAAASSGSLAMFHAVGVTPEAPTLQVACGGVVPDETIAITPQEVRDARDALSTATRTDLATVNLGTPHYSVSEIGALFDAIDGRTIHPSIELYVSTGREVLHDAMQRGWVESLEAAGVTFVTDTCTYITPIVRNTTGVAMTDSAKWAYYAPGNIGVAVVFGSLSECVESAVEGVIVRDEELWSGAS